MNNNIYIIDGNLLNIDAILQQLPEESNYLILDGEQDSIQQILHYLKDFEENSVASLHLVSHGSDGNIFLGNSTLNNDSLPQYENDLATIGKYLTDDGDILLYGCNVAKTQEGRELVQAIASITSADVAASDDITALPKPKPETKPEPEPELTSPEPALEPVSEQITEPEPELQQEQPTSETAPQPTSETAPKTSTSTTTTTSGDADLEYEVGQVETKANENIIQAAGILNAPDPYANTDISRSDFGGRGDFSAELLYLGSATGGFFNAGSGIDSYLITSLFRADRVDISDLSASNNFYFDKGVEIAFIGGSSGAGFRLANGTIVNIASSGTNQTYYFGSGGVGMTYAEFTQTLKDAGVAGVGDAIAATFTVNDYVHLSDLTFDANSSVSGNYRGGQEVNLISFGSSQDRIGSGGSGKDVYRLTQFQRGNVEISDLGQEDLIILEYGVQIINVATDRLRFIGGEVATPLVRNLDVSGSSIDYFQIGEDTNLRYTGAELVANYGETGLPIDLALTAALRENWTDANKGTLVNLSDDAVELNGEMVAGGKVYFYNDTELLMQDGNPFAIDVGENAHLQSVHDNNIAGSKYDDFIVGNDNNNNFRGGGGADTFIFTANFGTDAIADFESGADKIILYMSAVNYSIINNSITVTDAGGGIEGTIAVTGSIVASDIKIEYGASPIFEIPLYRSYSEEGEYTIGNNIITYETGFTQSLPEVSNIIIFNNRNSNSSIVLEDTMTDLQSVTSNGAGKDALDMSQIFQGIEIKTNSGAVKIGNDYDFIATGFYGFLSGGNDDIFTLHKDASDSLFDGKGNSEQGDRLIYEDFTGTLSIADSGGLQFSSAAFGNDIVRDIEVISFTASADLTMTANEREITNSVNLELSDDNNKIILQSIYNNFSVSGGSGDDNLSLQMQDATITMTTNSLTSNGNRFEYSNIETISLNENGSVIVFDALNDLPDIVNATTVAIGDNLTSATFAINAENVLDKIENGDMTLVLDGIDSAIGGSGDDVFDIFRSVVLDGGGGADFFLSFKTYGSTIHGGSDENVTDTINYVHAVTDFSFSLNDGITIGDATDKLHDIEVVNISGHDDGSTLTLSSDAEGNIVLPENLQTISIIGGNKHVADFSNISATLTIDADAGKITLADSNFNLLGFSHFVGGQLSNHFIDKGGVGNNLYENTGDASAVIEYGGSQSLNASLTLLSASDTILADAQYGNDILRNVDTITVDSNNTADDNIVINDILTGANFEKLTIEVGGGNDTFTLNGSHDKIFIYGGDDNDQFIVNSAIARGNLFGGEGYDTFTINSLDSSEPLKIDGGYDTDIIKLKNDFTLTTSDKINDAIEFKNIETLSVSAELSTLTLLDDPTDTRTGKYYGLAGHTGQTIVISSDETTISNDGNLMHISIHDNRYAATNFNNIILNGGNNTFYVNNDSPITFTLGTGIDSFYLDGSSTFTINNFDSTKDIIDFTEFAISIYDLDITTSSDTTTIRSDDFNISITIVGDAVTADDLIISRERTTNNFEVGLVNYSLPPTDSINGSVNSIDTLDFSANYEDFGSDSTNFVFANIGDNNQLVNYLGANIIFPANTAGAYRLEESVTFSVQHIDHVIGSGGSDVLIGNDGNNRLDGGAGGDDIFYGGKGDDTFAILPASGAGDFIADFGMGLAGNELGKDSIDLTGFSFTSVVNLNIDTNTLYADADITFYSSDLSLVFELALDQASVDYLEFNSRAREIGLEIYFKENPDAFIGFNPYADPNDRQKVTKTIGTDFNWLADADNRDIGRETSIDKFDIFDYRDSDYNGIFTPAIMANLSSISFLDASLIDGIEFGFPTTSNGGAETLAVTQNAVSEYQDNNVVSVYKVYSLDGIYGTKGGDLFYGSNAGEILAGNSGDNIIFGRGGHDIISATGTGTNLLHGGDGNDTISGGSGNDIIISGDGDDTLTGGGGNDNFATFYYGTSHFGTNTISDFDALDSIFIIVDKAIDPSSVVTSAVSGAVNFSIADNEIGTIEFTGQDDISAFLPRINIVHADDELVPLRIRAPLAFTIAFDSTAGNWQLDNAEGERQLILEETERFYLVWDDANSTSARVNSFAELSQSHAAGDFSIAVVQGNLQLTFSGNEIITIDHATDYADTADDSFDNFVAALGGEELFTF